MNRNQVPTPTAVNLLRSGSTRVKPPAQVAGPKSITLRVSDASFSKLNEFASALGITVEFAAEIMVDEYLSGRTDRPALASERKPVGQYAASSTVFDTFANNERLKVRDEIRREISNAVALAKFLVTKLKQ